MTSSSNASEPETSRAEARVTFRDSSALAGCLDSVARLRFSDGSQTTTTTWCTGAGAGWAGENVDGSAILRTDRPAKPDRTGSGHTSQPPGTFSGSSARLALYRFLDERMYPVNDFSVGSSTMAGDAVVTARAAGLVEAWIPYPRGPAGLSNRYLRWRAWPGGVVSALTAAGAVTVVASSADAVTAYAPDGIQLWRVQTDDIVTALHAAGNRLVLVEASGRIRMLDARTGRTTWNERLATTPQAAADARFIAVAADGRLTVLEAGSGNEVWSGVTTTAEPPVITGDVVATLEAGGALVARSLETGSVRWSRTVDPLADLSGSTDQLLVRGATSMLDLASDGAVNWRRPSAQATTVDGRWTALAFAGRVELLNVDGRSQSWPYPARYTAPDQLQITDRGVLAWWQRGPDGSRNVEYR